jgi:hypothetical protein
MLDVIVQSSSAVAGDATPPVVGKDTTYVVVYTGPGVPSVGGAAADATPAEATVMTAPATEAMRLRINTCFN